jgi:peptidoglycan/LPS O-acetylase OafA/YrhL
MRRVLWWIIVLLVVITSISGLWNSFQDWQQSNSLGEQMVTIAVICYGVAGAILLFAMLRKRKWIMVPLIVWSVAIAFAATAAPYVYSPDEGRWIGTIASGISTIALFALIVLRVRKEASSW